MRFAPAYDEPRLGRRDERVGTSAPRLRASSPTTCGGPLSSLHGQAEAAGGKIELADDVQK